MKKRIFVFLFAIIAFSAFIAFSEDAGNSIGVITFTYNQNEIDAGSVVTISYSVSDTSVRIRNVRMIADYGYSAEVKKFDFYNKTKDTCSITPVSDGKCWLEINYSDKDGNLKTVNSEYVLVHGIVIDTIVKGVDEENTLAVGDTIQVEYMISGGNGEYEVETCWCISAGGAGIELNKQMTTQSSGRCEYTPEKNVSSFSFHIFVRDKNGVIGRNVSKYNQDKYYVKGGNSRYTNNNDDIRIEIDKVKITAGEQITATYEVLNKNIKLLGASWFEQEKNLNVGMFRNCELTEGDSGTATYTPNYNGICLLYIYYEDLNGNYYKAKSEEVNILGCEIDVKISGYIDNQGMHIAEAGEPIVAEYTITGSDKITSVETYWEVIRTDNDRNLMIDRISNQELTGKSVCTPENNYASVSLYIRAYNGEDACLYFRDDIIVNNDPDWYAVKYVWARDHKTVTASRKSKRNPAIIESETVDTKLQEIFAPTEVSRGYAYYEAERFKNTYFYGEGYTADIPPLGKMNTIYLPIGVQVIDEEAISGLTSCEAIIIPDGCKVINPHAFDNCENLLYVKMPKGGIEQGNILFENCPYVIIDDQSLYSEP